MRIATVYEGAIVNAYYRAIVPLRELERRGHRVLWPVNPSFAATFETVPDCELVHMHRCPQVKDLEAVRRLRASGIAVVWDNDDDITALKNSRLYRKLDRSHSHPGRKEAREIFKRTVDIANTASVMTTPSQHLAQRYRDAGARNVRVIENYLAPISLRGRRRRHAGLVIGCVAAFEHYTDLVQLKIAEVLTRILRAHEGVRVVAIGADLGIRDPRYSRLQQVPVEQLIDAESEFDIGIAPLDDTLFNRSRSNIKLKEYAAAGAAWLASPVGPYAVMGEEQGGRLVADHEWFDALDELVRDYPERLRLTEQARAWAKQQSIEHAADKWEATFRAAVRDTARTVR